MRCSAPTKQEPAKQGLSPLEHTMLGSETGVAATPSPQPPHRACVYVTTTACKKTSARSADGDAAHDARGSAAKAHHQQKRPPKNAQRNHRECVIGHKSCVCSSRVILPLCAPPPHPPTPIHPCSTVQCAQGSARAHACGRKAMIFRTSKS
jgi:hypothetical protein